MAEQDLEGLSNLAALIPFYKPGSTEDWSHQKLSNEAIHSIAEVLRGAGKDAWSRLPRIYAVLYAVDQVHAMDSFIEEKASDFSLPFNSRNLPSALNDATIRLNFLEAQQLILSKDLYLRRNFEHCHYRNEEDVPLEYVAELGQGGYGHVDRVRCPGSCQEYARKLFPRGLTFKKDKEALSQVENELAILKRLSHEHVVKLVGSYTESRFVGILMLPIASCNLQQYLQNGPNRHTLQSFFGCLATALAFLHRNSIRHKDIKPTNILVHNATVIFTDFGLSRDWTSLNHSTTTGLTAKTPRYAAPEVAAQDPRNSSADVWSLGCVFLEMWTSLLGLRVTDLHGHLTTNGSCSSCYYLNIAAVNSWIDSLPPSGYSAKGCLPNWITNTLLEQRRLRWSAQAICSRIQEESQTGPYSYIGRCCKSTTNVPRKQNLPNEGNAATEPNASSSFGSLNSRPFSDRKTLEQRLAAMRNLIDQGSRERADDIFEDLLDIIERSLPPNHLHGVMQSVFNGEELQGLELEHRFEQLCSSHKNQYGIAHSFTVEAYVAYAIVLNQILEQDVGADEPDVGKIVRCINTLRELLNELLDAHFPPVLSQTFLWRKIDEEENDQGKMEAVDENASIHINEEIIRGCMKLPCLLEAVRLAGEYDDLCSRCVVEKVTANVVEMGFAIRTKDENGAQGVRLAPWLVSADPPEYKGDQIHFNIMEMPGAEKIQKWMKSQGKGKKGKETEETEETEDTGPPDYEAYARQLESLLVANGIPLPQCVGGRVVNSQSSQAFG